MSKKLTFIAEIGLNHNGNFGLFFELIKQASIAGADFAKFQLGWRDKKDEINNLGNDEIELIKKCCDFHGIKPLFSIFTNKAYELVKKHNFNAYKIASRTVVDNKKLVKEILDEKKRTFISLGMTDEKAPFGSYDNIEYLWCKSEYPALPWVLKDIPKDFTKTNPSEAVRLIFFEAFAIPFFLKNSTDFSKSPLVSSSATLQSLKPTPVISLSFLILSNKALLDIKLL